MLNNLIGSILGFDYKLMSQSNSNKNDNLIYKEILPAAPRQDFINTKQKTNGTKYMYL